MSPFHVETMMYRDVLWVPGPSLMTFALVKINASPEEPAAAAPPPVNLALVLDVSGSMYETDDTRSSRLRRVQEAAVSALDLLRPEDRVAVVAFGKSARTVLASGPLGDRRAARAVLEQIDRFDVEAGGTALHEGMKLALSEVRRGWAAGTTNAMVVLTDGETAAEPLCRELARAASERSVTISTMGVGLDWNEVLLKELSRIGGGRWHYIDVAQPGSAAAAFRRELAALAELGTREAVLEVQPTREVRVKRGRQVVPEIGPLPLDESDGRVARFALGKLARHGTSAYMLDLSIPPRPSGKYVLARVRLTFEAGSTAAAEASLDVTYAPEQASYVNAEVARRLDEIQIDRLNGELQAAIGGEDRQRIQGLAQNIHKTALRLGTAGARKTQLAERVLSEVAADGRVSRKTQLALDDQARRGAGGGLEGAQPAADLPPAPAGDFGRGGGRDR